jgi:hypothetical protein
MIGDGDSTDLAERYKRLLLLESGISHVRDRYDRGK